MTKTLRRSLAAVSILFLTFPAQASAQTVSTASVSTDVRQYDLYDYAHSHHFSSIQCDAARIRYLVATGDNGVCVHNPDHDNLWTLWVPTPFTGGGGSGGY